MVPWFDTSFLLEMRTGLQILQACCNTPMPSPFVVFSEFHMASQLFEQNVWYESRLLIREKQIMVMGCMRLTARSEARGVRLRKATIKHHQTRSNIGFSYAQLCSAMPSLNLDCFHSFVNSDTPFDCASYKSQDAPKMTGARLFDRSHGRITSTNHDEPS